MEQRSTFYHRKIYTNGKRNLRQKKRRNLQHERHLRQKNDATYNARIRVSTERKDFPQEYTEAPHV